jgi:hypothetical protein
LAAVQVRLTETLQRAISTKEYVPIFDERWKLTLWRGLQPRLIKILLAVGKSVPTAQMKELSLLFRQHPSSVPYLPRTVGSEQSESTCWTIRHVCATRTSPQAYQNNKDRC